jgi:hypothetical protein
MKCFFRLNTCKGNTVVNKCDQCFYALMDKEAEAPCASCQGYSNFVKGDVYATNHSSKPLKEAIDDWFKGVNGVTSEDFWYDTVEKPKHYMLFEDQGIEVRDVIQKLVDKFDQEAIHKFTSHMFIADYVQMMQYLMRFMDKNGQEDLKKARWYLDKLIEAYESDF